MHSQSWPVLLSQELKQQIADLSAKKTAAEQTRDSAQERCAELERQIKDFESERKDKVRSTACCSVIGGGGCILMLQSRCALNR